MRICLMMAAVFAPTWTASAAGRDQPTAILVIPIHEAQIVRADDGKDHVEYELLVINAFPEAVTLSSVTVLDPAEKRTCADRGRRAHSRHADCLRADADGRHSRIGRSLR